MQPVERNAAGWLGVYVRGVAMGLAEVVPGVSGGTIAFITGIWLELVNTIRSLRPALIVTLWREGPASAWRACNASFALALLAGMGTSIVLFARFMQWALVHHDIAVWSFFFGLILASAVVVGNQIQGWNQRTGLVLVLGVLLGLLVARAPPLSDVESLGFVFVAGALAVCAWILPGVSGSFVLLLLGVYANTLRAIAELDLLHLAVLAAGCATGLLSFAQLLGWLFERARASVLALLVGFMTGSLIKLWPWQRIVSYIIDERGLARPIVTEPISPWRYAESTGDPALPGVAVVAMLLGIVVVIGLEWWGRRTSRT